MKIDINLLDLSGKVAIVTGGGDGIGKGCAEILAAAGASVVVSNRHLDKAERTMEEIKRTDSFISGIIPRETFSLRYTEKVMGADHFRCYDNRTSPLGAALLIDRLYADDSLLEDESLKFLRTALMECKTGNDRIVAPLTGIERVKVGHKTGSGYMIGETLTCHNDIGHIKLPDGRSYTLAVFVKDLKGNEAQASSAISRISSTVYSAILSTK